MADFFRGWRRKVGLVTLLLAAIFVGGWLRGMTLRESIAFPIGINRFSVVSDQDSLYLTREYNGDPRMRVIAVKSTPLAASTLLHDAIHDRSIFWKWRRFGFGYYHCAFDDIKYSLTLFMMPHRRIAIPLTLISVCLLLSKPRKAVAKAAPLETD